MQRSAPWLECVGMSTLGLFCIAFGWWAFYDAAEPRGLWMMVVGPIVCIARAISLLRESFQSKKRAPLDEL